MRDGSDADNDDKPGPRRENGPGHVAERTRVHSLRASRNVIARAGRDLENTASDGPGPGHARTRPASAFDATGRVRNRVSGPGRSDRSKDVRGTRRADGNNADWAEIVGPSYAVRPGRVFHGRPVNTRRLWSERFARRLRVCAGTRGVLGAGCGRSVLRDRKKREHAVKSTERVDTERTKRSCLKSAVVREMKRSPPFPFACESLDVVSLSVDRAFRRRLFGGVCSNTTSVKSSDARTRRPRFTPKNMISYRKRRYTRASVHRV